jgi:RNA polymerase sigma factor (sigma-70 family)
MDEAALKTWFVGSVLPLEPSLGRMIRRHCRNAEDVIDVRQEVYERALRGAARGLPATTRHYVFAIARNVLIDRARREKVVSFEQVADLEELNPAADLNQTDRQLDARDQLRRALAGLDRLPPRCREVVRLRKIEGLSVRDTATRLGVTHHTVERQLTLGIRAITDFMLGGDGRIDRGDHPSTREEATR